jgi:hypothetical protein
MDRDVHDRFLRYREAFSYFALQGRKQLGREEFEMLDAEQQTLDKKGATRSDEEEVRFVELNVILFRD